VGETPSRIRGAGFVHVWERVMLLVALMVFRAPRVLCRAGLLGVPVGRACPRAVCAASFARRVVSKP